MRQRLNRARGRLQPRVAAFAVALLLFAGLLTFATLQSNRDAAPAPSVAPFRLEASIVTLSPVLADGGREEEVLSTIRYWYQSPRLRRLEIETTDLANQQEQIILSVADGERHSVYLSTEGTFTTTPLDELQPPLFIPIRPTLGPVVMEELLESWVAYGISVQSSGVPQPYLGRETVVYQYRDGSQVGRIWYDPELNLILRHSIDAGPNQPYEEARVLLLDLQPDHDRSLFRFVPPEGAIEAD